MPQVAKALGVAADAALLKGRANYACHHRLGLQMRQSDLLGEGESESFAELADWVAASEHGDIAEFTGLGEDAPLWKRVTSTADNCLGGQCPDFARCFVMKARKRAMQAGVVVVNHHLFFSDLTLKSDGIGELLPQHDAVVFDEAHHVAAVASDFFGFSVSTAQIAELVADALAAERDEKSGVAFADAEAELEDALAKMSRAALPLAGQSAEFEALMNAKFARAAQALWDALAQFERALAAAAPVGDGLKRCHQRCLSLQDRFDTWRERRDSGLISWAAIGAGARHVRFHATPLKVNARFAEMMDAHPAAWIFTSATLALGDDFSAFCEELGLHAADTRRWDSPYDYRRNALLYLPPGMPEPRTDEYEHALRGVLLDVIGASRGRAFCLFTSIAMMRRMHARLRAQTDWSIFLQGDAPKSELLGSFRRAANAVLFGTSSFWEGVDVQGERLSCVIIDKLPFAPPSEPVLKSRLEACEQEGGNPFMTMQLPAAVIALKQGAGRLIRSESDRGVLVLCDPRISGKGYGKIFLQSLPGMTLTREMADVAAFFNDG
ncbi:MAG: ATP-dependent DNA helicase [Gammaproteobacteria bacterium]